jgi:hypothetical protein
MLLTDDNDDGRRRCRLEVKKKKLVKKIKEQNRN